jgi:hypothetical protein
MLEARISEQHEGRVEVEIWGKLPEKYRVPPCVFWRYVRSWRIAMQGNVDRDSRSGDQHATIGQD